MNIIKLTLLLRDYYTCTASTHTCEHYVHLSIGLSITFPKVKVLAALSKKKNQLPTEKCNLKAQSSPYRHTGTVHCVIQHTFKSPPLGLLTVKAH